MNENSLVLVRNNTGQWEDKTGDIAERIADPASGSIRIRYKNNLERWYSYRQERVRLLDVKAILNPSEIQIRVSGRLLSSVDSIIEYPDFYVVTVRGNRKLYAAAQLRVERDVTVDPSCRGALDYFRAVAELGSARSEDGEPILVGQYQYLSRVTDASVLAVYLNPGFPLSKSNMPSSLIYPFGTNASQKYAVEEAFRSQVCIVQGPPGTGKTQTILNIVANAIRLKQTVAVVSNNNAATKNVADKLEGNDLGFLLANLGKRENKKAFIESQIGYPDWIAQSVRDQEEISRLDARIAELTAVLDGLIKANNNRALLAERIAQTRSDVGLHQKISGSAPPSDVQARLDRWTANDLLELLVECEEAGPNARNGLLRTLKDIFLHGLSGRKVRRQLLAAGPLALRTLYYGKHLQELQAQLSDVERFLSENNFQAVEKQVKEVSWELLRAVLAERFRDKTRPTFTERELWSKYASVLDDYPIVLSTTHSLKTSLSPDSLYDLVIIDEASQVDVATGVLALSCARRAVIVGDENQLPNVIDGDSRQRADEIWNECRLAYPAWNYSCNSLLSSATAAWPQAPNVLLREHYRCHPKIAGFFNQKFYAGQLVIMTAEHGESNVLQAVFTVPGRHARDRINQRQIDVIGQEILPALRREGVFDIGIISPYRAQVAELRNAFGESVQVDTVHGFQGREKAAIIMSTVDNEIGEFVDDAKLINVAVSRAKRNFTVVMSAVDNNFTTNFGDLVRYIRRQNQSVLHSEIRSVFDLLYADYADVRRDFLNARGRGSVWDSENLAETVISDVLKSQEFARISLGCMRHVPLAWLGLVVGTPDLSERERQFVTNPWSHVDFLIYDTIGKLPLVGVEVDGWAFHRPGSLQSERDEVKNAIFRRAGLPLVRLSTTGSGESTVIANALRGAVGLTIASAD